jgi:hypothetical protein
MGHTIWVEVHGRSGDDPARDNSIMLRLQDQLDALATKLGVPKLSEFYDYSELEAAYGDLGGDEDEAEVDDPPDNHGQNAGDWFEPGPALAAVQALEDHLAQHPEALGFVPDRSRAHWPVALKEELRHCRSVLEDAVSRGQQLRFLIVP